MPKFNEFSQNEMDISYGCLFCKTGSEKELTKTLQSIEGIQAIAPERQYRRRINGTMKILTEILFPGYVFFRVLSGFDALKLLRYADVLKLLTTEKKWQLQNADAEFAQWLFQQGNVLTFSQAYFEGDRIRIIDGPLKNYEGMIMKVNRRFQNAQIVLSFRELQIKVWLGYEKIAK